MVFWLYTSSTIEETILRLAEHNVTIDRKLQNISRSTSDVLLMWGATYLFNKLDEFHNASGVNTCSEESLLDKLLEEFVNLITYVRMNKDATKLMITRAQPICGIYGKNPTEPNKTGEEQPHTFWRKLLVGRNPCWKYLAMSNPRQRKSKRPQYIEKPPKKITNDDVSCKHKKTTNNIIESVASKPVTEEGEVVGASKSQSFAGDSFWSDATTTSFHDILKLKISKLCEVLDLSCWSGSELLKHKLDRTQYVALANEHLNFSCNEEETRQIYLKLESAMEMFIRYTKNQKKTYVSEDSIREMEAINGLDLAKFLDVGIKASGKLQFLDLILPELRKQKLRVLIIYQDSASIRYILDDFLHQRFGEDSYERIDGVGIVPSKKQAALNNCLMKFKKLKK
ncbi:helicase protein MOM1-like protein isoform X1 [Tanacetum coccineum]|uniref:Helicase protein MOM1-like protein isoform X1 n=1 Tax=Tanacetum coccineum TaxID=301880 RepID=A0ABQ5FMG4_9ASTR